MGKTRAKPKNPRSTQSIRGFPFLSLKSLQPPFHTRDPMADIFCTGRSSDFPPDPAAFPFRKKRNSDHGCRNVPFRPFQAGKGRGHSGGSVPDSHGVPCSALKGAPERWCYSIAGFKICQEEKARDCFLILGFFFPMPQPQLAQSPLHPQGRLFGTTSTLLPSGAILKPFSPLKKRAWAGTPP